MAETFFPDWFEYYGKDDFDKFRTCVDGFLRRYDSAVYALSNTEVTSSQLKSIDATISFGKAAIDSWRNSRKGINKYLDLREADGKSAIMNSRSQDLDDAKADVITGYILDKLLEESFSSYVADIKQKNGVLIGMRTFPRRIIE